MSRAAMAASCLAAAVACTAAATGAHAQALSRPTACSSCIADWYYFDEGGVSDWNCGGSTYDGHSGSDFSLAGGNPAIDDGYDVVAAGDGMVASTEDGHFDKCTSCGGASCGLDVGDGYGNHVVIEHSSGHKVIYAHMRQGSVRVSPGDTVSCGEVIGQIGSSGCTTGAHLHFESRPGGGSYSSAFDPFEGDCSPTSPSLWNEQGSYRGLPGATCSDPPPTCPDGTHEIWTCTDGGSARERCIDGEVMTETCEHGCESMPAGTDDTCAPPPSTEDADRDGSPADEDCDDMDATRFPGAGENCGDGIDQDCDGADLPCDGGTGSDAGTVPGDGGPPRDSGSSGKDAGSGADAGGGWSSSADRALDGGCGCAAPGQPRESAPLFGALLVAVVLRRLRVGAIDAAVGKIRPIGPRTPTRGARAGRPAAPRAPGRP